jgi:hypothetical protein
MPLCRAQINRSGAPRGRRAGDQLAAHIGGYVRAVVKRALMLQPPEGDDLPACLCAGCPPDEHPYMPQRVRGRVAPAVAS